MHGVVFVMQSTEYGCAMVGQHYSEHRPYSLGPIPEGASSPSSWIAATPIATDSSIFALIAALLIVQTFP